MEIEPQKQPTGVAALRQMLENKNRMQEGWKNTTNLHEMLDEDERFIEFEKRYNTQQENK